MKLREKEQAIVLRKQGFSLKEISEKVKVAKGTVSLWVKDIELTPKACIRLLARIKKGQYISARNKRKKTELREKMFEKEARKWASGIRISAQQEKLICAMIYWCEGAKGHAQGIDFTNSDPYLVKYFIDLLGRVFSVPRDKICARLHLHSYHDPEKQKKFWAKILRISEDQFRNPYLKPNSKKRIRKDYPGCINIRYYDSILARKIMHLAKAYIYTGV
jgi:hypothetical protein